MLIYYIADLAISCISILHFASDNQLAILCSPISLVASSPAKQPRIERGVQIISMHDNAPPPSEVEDQD